MEVSLNHMQDDVKTMTATCPACGLLCDDISLEISQRIKVANRNCAKSVQFFEQPLGENSPQINGKSATLSQAISHAAILLKASKKPLFTGLSTDVQGFRAIYSLAQKTNGHLQHLNSESMARNMAVLQSTGWQATTLTEVKNRADVLVCIGTDIVSHNTRFFERFMWLSQESSAMFTDASKREVIYIGENLNTQAGVSPDGKQPISINCSQSDLPEILAVLRALVAGKKLKAQTVAGIQVSDLMVITDKLKQAKYAVLAWIAKDLDYPHAELAIQTITETVALLNNQTGRAAGLSLGGSDGDTSANNANTWLSGFSLNNTKTEHDVLVWINSFSAEKLPPKLDKPLIVLGNANTILKQIPDVFIPIATPGLDCSGTLFRVDSAVILPLKKLRKNNLSTCNEVISQIEVLLS
ncbi:MAG: formylmethanofuran dehydrogenase [Proteobacteria bacterium ST_bin12]|nr:MAG: formylmethanofuran dehydrogenase [Proteobacteria bacterium ST_bin12]